MENKKTKEIRAFQVTEIRANPTEAGPTILEGYAAVYNSPSEDMGWGSWEVREYIAPGAFAKALKKSDCRALFNHNSDYVLGREAAGTLSLVEDEKGLRMSVTMPDTQLARDLTVSVTRGDINQMSFGFYVGVDSWETDYENKKEKRTIVEVDELIDVSLVTWPAYPDTTVAKRSYDKYKATRGDDAAAGKARMELRFRILEMEEKLI